MPLPQPFFNKQTAIMLGLLLALAYFPLFLHLDMPEMQLWDEGRLAVNAAEMLEQGNPIVTYYNDKPETWNLKPPLMIWLQAISIKLLGYNMLATRLPAALAGLATVLFLFYFLRKRFNSALLGFVAGAVLLTCGGYIVLHVTRTGDYDALLILFTTIAIFYFFDFLNAKEAQPKRSIYIVGAALTLAVLTKGVAGLLFLPGMLLYAVVSGNLKRVLFSKQVYVSVLFSMLVVIGYYLLREVMQPGYLQLVIDNELSGRYMQTLEGHSEPWHYYLDELMLREFKPWWVVVLLSIPVYFISHNSMLKQLSLCLWLCVGCFLAVISFSQTRIGWYEAPVYPLLSTLVAISFYILYSKFRSALFLVRAVSGLYLLICAVFVGLLISSYSMSISRVYFNKGVWDYQQNGPDILHYMYEHHPEIKTYYFYQYESPNPNVLFYRIPLHHQGYHIGFIDSLRDATESDYAVTYSTDPRWLDNADRDFEVIDKWGYGVLIRLK